MKTAIDALVRAENTKGGEGEGVDEYITTAI
jgi:hypothetical protein